VVDLLIMLVDLVVEYNIEVEPVQLVIHLLLVLLKEILVEAAQALVTQVEAVAELWLQEILHNPH
tara:strand:+ start:38 stop:232 length:195 start_codon:yes stop_codon:yes gene_type:complete